MKPYLVTFCTEGPPYDNGYDLTDCASQIREKLSQYFEEIFIFTPRTLKLLPGSDDFCNSWPEALDANPNANHVGYFDFKSFLIDHVLQKIPEGSILMYHDGNFKRCPNYWESDWKNIDQILNYLLSIHGHDVFCCFEQKEVKVKNNVKNYVLTTLFPDSNERKIVAESMLINAAKIIVRNSNFSRQFIKEFMELCLRKDLLAKSPTGDIDPEFKWSCGDQDVLNALIYRYILDGKLSPQFPGITFLYRVMTFERKFFTWKFENWEPWHDRPHPTEAQLVHNHELIEYIDRRKNEKH